MAAEAVATLDELGGRPARHAALRLGPRPPTAAANLDNLQKSLLPLAIPLGTIGLAGGGVAYMLGNHLTQRVLGGVVAGTALVLLSPQLMA